MGEPPYPLYLTWLADDIIIIISREQRNFLSLDNERFFFSNKNKSAQCNIGNMFWGQPCVCFAS